MRDIIIEDNRLDTNLRYFNAKTVTVRNNVISVIADQEDNAPIYLDGINADSLPNNFVDDVMIYNNSLYNGCADCDVRGVALHHDLTPWTFNADFLHIRNNLLWTTTSGVKLPFWCQDASDLCDASTTLNATYGSETNNVLPGSSPFADSTPEWDSITDWYLTGAGASSAIDQGAAMDGTANEGVVLDDIEGKRRPDRNWDIGATELDHSTLRGVTATGATFQ
jgi:hypothetical protein